MFLHSIVLFSVVEFEISWYLVVQDVFIKHLVLQNEVMLCNCKVFHVLV